MPRTKTDAELIARAKQPTEKQFLAMVVKLAKLRGWLVYHTHDSRNSAAGFPDLAMVRNGVVIFAELKVGKNKLSPAQSLWLIQLKMTPNRAYVFYPDDWSDIEAVLA